MSDVQFDDQNSYSYSSYSRIDDTRKGIVGLVIKTGLVKNEKQANFVLVVLMILCVVVALSLLFGMNKRSPAPPRDQIIWVAGPTQ